MDLGFECLLYFIRSFRMGESSPSHVKYTPQTNKVNQTTLLWKIFPAHIYVTALCVLWGTCAMCSGAVQNMTQLIVCRVFLGVFEASFGAGA